MAQPLPRDRSGKVIKPGPIHVESPDSPYRAGIPHHDAEEGVTYRVVPYLNVQEGWGTAGFWSRRWRCQIKLVLTLAARGWLDAAIDGAHTKRYRCRDEQRCLDWIATQRSRSWKRQKG